MQGQQPLTVVLLAVIAVLAIFAGYQVLRIAWGIARALRARGPTFDAKGYEVALYALEREVATLSLADARTEAERLLNDSAYLRAEPAPVAQIKPADLSRLAALAPLQRELLTRYVWVGTADREEYAAAAEVGPYEYAAAYVRLGPGSSDGHVDLATRRGEETIFQLANDVPAAERVQLSVGSVHHWLVYLHRHAELRERCGARHGVTRAG